MIQEWIYIENSVPGQAVLAILPPQGSPEKAPEAAIVGTFALKDESEGKQPDPATFQANPEFLSLLQKVIEQSVLSDPEFKDASFGVVNANIELVDQRVAGHEGDPVPEDIFGILKIRNGTLAGYDPNPKYILYTRKGMFRLPEKLQPLLLEEVRTRASK